jgi:hypothetical protein
MAEGMTDHDPVPKQSADGPVAQEAKVIFARVALHRTSERARRHRVLDEGETLADFGGIVEKPRAYVPQR